MIDYRARALRLQELRRAVGFSYEQFGRLAGISAAAAHKACRTGRIDETTADRLVAALRREHPSLKADLGDLMYGAPGQRVASEADLDRATALQILASLPPRQRDTWISIGQVLVQQYAPIGPAKPFVGVETRVRRTVKA